MVAAHVPAQAVIDAVREGAGELLEDVQLFDVFTGPQIGEDRKSLTLGAAVPRGGSHIDRRRRQLRHATPAVRCAAERSAR